MDAYREKEGLCFLKEMFVTRSVCSLLFFFSSLSAVQTELDNINGLLSQAEGKNIKYSKDVSTLESQLQDAQVQT